MALEQNREVFAIPGSIYNPLARGCNALIREGAKLVETTQDIAEELKYHFQQSTFNETKAPSEAPSDLSIEQQTLLNFILFSPTSIDSLVTKSNFSVEIISSHLLILELQGYISPTHGGGYSRIK